jgi:hypothetical protein
VEDTIKWDHAAVEHEGIYPSSDEQEIGGSNEHGLHATNPCTDFTPLEAVVYKPSKKPLVQNLYKPRRQYLQLIDSKEWLPGMDSNHGNLTGF